MSKKANPTLVGGFALGAIALAVLAIALLGSGSLFSYRPKAVAFFQGNIQGLTVGAPVTLTAPPASQVINESVLGISPGQAQPASTAGPSLT